MLEIYVNEQAFMLNESINNENSYIYKVDSLYFSTFTLIATHCNETDICLEYRDKIYYLGRKKTKKTDDVRFFDIEISKTNDKEDMVKKPSTNNTQRVNNLKLLYQHKEDIMQNVTNKEDCELNKIHNLTQLLLLGETKIEPIIKNFRYFFDNPDTALLSFLIDKMEKDKHLESLLYKKYVEVHTDILKRY